MTTETPAIIDDELYRLLREENIEEFNRLRAEGKTCKLSGVDLRGLDLHGMLAEKIDFSNSYFRRTNLSGVNLSTCNLVGASIRSASISGTYFPKDISANEIMLSVEHGTRMRKMD